MCRMGLTTGGGGGLAHFGKNWKFASRVILRLILKKIFFFPKWALPGGDGGGGVGPTLGKMGIKNISFCKLTF